MYLQRHKMHSRASVLGLLNDTISTGPLSDEIDSDSFRALYNIRSKIRDLLVIDDTEYTSEIWRNTFMLLHDLNNGTLNRSLMRVHY